MFDPMVDSRSITEGKEALRGEHLLERRRKQAQFRDSHKTLDNFDFAFNKKMNRSLIFDLSAGAFIAR
jgi:hypothetical protein